MLYGWWGAQKRVDLSGQGVGDSGARLAAWLLTKGSEKELARPEELNLRDNRIAKVGGEKLGIALETNTTLKELNLDKNDLRPEGMRLLANGLLANRTVTFLSVSRNSLGCDGAAHAARLLGSYNKSLKKLYLG